MADIRTSELRYRYRGEQEWTLSNITMDISAGAFVLLVGPSGSGKSTLARCFNGLIPHSLPGELVGSISVCGRDVTTTPQAELAKRVGLVFQNPDSQFVTTTVETEIAFGLENLCIDSREMSDRILDALDEVGLSGFETRAIESLSGGEKQRLAIACQLAMDPAILVLDEPTANLDPQGTRRVFQLLRELAQDESRTIILIEHQCDPLIDSLDHIFVLNENGALLVAGRPEDVFDEHACSLLDEGVWIPEVTRLALTLRANGCWPDETSLPVTVEQAADTVEEILADRTQARSPASEDAQRATGDKSTDPPALDIRRLNATYRTAESAEPVLNGIDLTVPAGSFLAVVGSNGAGKSTLAKHCVGVLSPPPETVYVDGHDITTLPSSEISHHIGYVFQNPEYQFVTNCVWDELAYGLRQLSFEPDEIERRVEQTLERFDLTAHADKNPFTLSHGEKRRLSVATMLIVGQDVLIVDEPTYGQDRANADALMETLSELHESGRTIIVLTHDMRIVAEYADSVAVMVDGEIQFRGTPSALFEDTETLSAAQLSRPPLAALTDQLSAWSGLATVDRCYERCADGHQETITGQQETRTMSSPAVDTREER